MTPRHLGPASSCGWRKLLSGVSRYQGHSDLHRAMRIARDRESGPVSWSQREVRRVTPRCDTLTIGKITSPQMEYGDLTNRTDMIGLPIQANNLGERQFARLLRGFTP